jgi:hypothetical protein
VTTPSLSAVAELFIQTHVPEGDTPRGSTPSVRSCTSRSNRGVVRIPPHSFARVFWFSAPLLSPWERPCPSGARCESDGVRGTRSCGHNSRRRNSTSKHQSAHESCCSTTPSPTAGEVPPWWHLELGVAHPRSGGYVLAFPLKALPPTSPFLPAGPVSPPSGRLALRPCPPHLLLPKAVGRLLRHAPLADVRRARRERGPLAIRRPSSLAGAVALAVRGVPCVTRLTVTVTVTRRAVGRAAARLPVEWIGK